MHIFVIHSAVTKAIAKGVILKLGLTTDNVKFFCFRNVAAIKGFNQIKLPAFSIESYKHFLRNRIEYARYLKQFEDRIRNTKYHLYLPHSADRIYHLLTTSKLCSSYSYIEEGMFSYFPKAQLNKNAFPFQLTSFQKLMEVITFGRRIFFNTKHKKYSAAYAISDKAFPGLKNVSLLDAKICFEGKANQEIRYLFISGGLVESGKTSLELYRKICEAFFKAYKDISKAPLYIKWHPSQSSIVKQEIKDIFANINPSQFIELNDAFDTEIECCNNSKLTVFQTTGSTGYYAAKAGRKVISISHLLGKSSKHLGQNEPAYCNTDIHYPASLHSLKQMIKQTAQ